MPETSPDQKSDGFRNEAASGSNVTHDWREDDDEHRWQELEYAE